jgi:hypothetical protein
MFIGLDPFILDKLNMINHKGMKTRISREMIFLLDDTFLQITNFYFDNNMLPIITVADCSGDNIVIYEFHLPNTYPFSPPKIIINNALYRDFLKIHTPMFLSLLKKITGLNCLCCNSFLCGENWTPVARFGKIIFEIRMFRKYRRDIINKYYADKVKSKYLLEDINLDEWLF